MKKHMSVGVLFDYPLPLPEDGDYAKQLDPDDWRPVQAVLDALKELGHEAKLLAFHDSIAPVVAQLHEQRPDVVFNLADAFRNDRLHEANLAGLLALCGVPYTGCPAEALTVCRVKSFAKRILVPLGIKLPQALVYPLGVGNRPLESLRFPVIVKPLSEEGSEGINKNSVCNDEARCLEQVRYLHGKLECDAYVEEYIEGREIYASVLGNQRLSVLPLREMVFKNVPEDKPRFASFQAKWDPAFREKWGIKNVFPKDLDDALVREIEQVSRQAYRTLGLRGCGRLDLRVTDKNEVYVIEVNPNPNLAPDDEVAQSALKAGLSYPQLIHKLLSLALREAEEAA
jgi:D-alanine-D-alanine ligase